MSEYAKRIGEVADILKVSLQTVRNWLNLGEEFFTEAATRQHGKRFTAADLDQLKRIQNLLSEGFKLDQIKTMLPAAPQIVDVIEDPPPRATDQQPTSQVNALETIDIFEQVQQLLKQQQENHQVTINAKDETIAVLQDENERLRDEVERLKRPWWKRW